MDILPNRIRERRHELGLTQEDLAKRLRVGTTYISKIENERVNINVTLAIRIARELNTTVEDIFLV